MPFVPLALMARRGIDRHAGAYECPIQPRWDHGNCRAIASQKIKRGSLPP
jgi:hypothetical protein